MSDKFEELEKAKAKVFEIEREIAAGPCLQYGHAYKCIGGASAGCGRDCNCSVEVLECTKCGDCDYGNTEREEVQRKCREGLES